ncbi:hypothetical protein [Pseudomonas cremoricolorata]|uniref:hypothetical protein n=1 Tax=Pseudomonas cremoricolorata TaxID=157783 RepID=UPI0006762B99|nr:hypothetical protein [Pseudomonas cremoricolorata]
MDQRPSDTATLRPFLADARRLLATAEDCMAHLQLIDDDADACHCLQQALSALARRAALAGVDELTRYAEPLRYLLSLACQAPRLSEVLLLRTQACLDLLAWQLELLDPSTGRIDLDEQEQLRLLHDLAGALDAQQRLIASADCGTPCTQGGGHSQPD